MNPETHFFSESPRSVAEDAFFEADRSFNLARRLVSLIDIKDPRKTVPFTVNGFVSRHVTMEYPPPGASSVFNPLPNARLPGKNEQHPPDLRGWREPITYRSFASASSGTLLKPGAKERLQVTILFGTGAEMHRHGLGAVIEQAAQPTMLIIIPGIEPSYQVEFVHPTNATKQTVQANNAWGIGITVDTIERMIVQRFGRLVTYDIAVAACFSTGQAGLGGCLQRGLVPVDRLERVVVYDCLYRSLKAPFDRVRGLKGSVKIVCYVASAPAANSFDGTPETFDNLSLRGQPGWSYVNIFFDDTLWAAAAARVMREAVLVADPLVTVRPSGFDEALAAILAVMPPRMKLLSDSAVYAKVKGPVPTDVVPLHTFAGAHAKEIQRFIAHRTFVRDALRNAQLMGWRMPMGEDRHDLVLVEFGWEYLI